MTVCTHQLKKFQAKKNKATTAEPATGNTPSEVASPTPSVASLDNSRVASPPVPGDASEVIIEKTIEQALQSSTGSAVTAANLSAPGDSSPANEDERELPEFLRTHKANNVSIVPPDLFGSSSNTSVHPPPPRKSSTSSLSRQSQIDSPNGRRSSAASSHGHHLSVVPADLFGPSSSSVSASPFSPVSPSGPSQRETDLEQQLSHQQAAISLLVSEKSALGATIKDLNGQLETLQELSDVTEQRLEELETKGKQDASKNEEARRKLQESLSREQAERQNAESRETTLQSQISDMVSIYGRRQVRKLYRLNVAWTDSATRAFSTLEYIITRRASLCTKHHIRSPREGRCERDDS